MLAYAAMRLPGEVIVTEHNVAILRKLDNGDFAYVSREEPAGSTYRVCPEDARNGVRTEDMLSQAVGYIADYAIWEERGSCRSIVRSDLGFWWKDANTNFEYVLIPKGGNNEQRTSK